MKYSITRAPIRAACMALAVSAVLALTLLVNPTAAESQELDCTSAEVQELHGVTQLWRGNCVVLDTAIIHVADGSTIAEAIEGLSSIEGWELDHTIDNLGVIIARRGGVIDPDAYFVYEYSAAGSPEELFEWLRVIGRESWAENVHANLVYKRSLRRETSVQTQNGSTTTTNSTTTSTKSTTSTTSTPVTGNQNTAQPETPAETPAPDNGDQNTAQPEPQANTPAPGNGGQNSGQPPNAPNKCPKGTANCHLYR